MTLKELERQVKELSAIVGDVLEMQKEGAPTLGGGIHQAMAQVMATVGYVQKTGSISFGERYTFAGESDLIAAIRPMMVEYGIYGPMPVAVESVIGEHAPTKRGAMQFRCDVLVTYRFTHGPSGTFVDVQAPGCGIDTADKATPKAMTAAYKYCLRQTFCIETGDDPDERSSKAMEIPVNGRQDRQAPVEATQQAAAPQNAVSTEHDAEWENDRVRFCAKLRKIGLDYDKVRDWAVAKGKGKPSTWGTQGRAQCVRDLLGDKIPELIQSEPGAAG